jgi:hypothetical protein
MEHEVIVFDSSGNSISDSVLVAVQDASGGLNLGDITLFISIGSVVVIVVILGVICRSKGQGAPGSVGSGYSW